MQGKSVFVVGEKAVLGSVSSRLKNGGLQLLKARIPKTAVAETLPRAEDFQPYGAIRVRVPNVKWAARSVAEF